MSELEAVKALKKNDEKAFKYLFERYYERLTAYIISYNHSQAKSEDIVQQSFIDFWENRLKLDETKSPKAYLYAIAYNKYIDSIKKEKKHEKLFEQLWERALRDRIQEDNETLDLKIQKMRQIIETLPPKCREIIIMNKLEGIKYKDIAKKLDISIKTVESQMRIAFTKIREASKGIIYLYISFLKNK